MKLHGILAALFTLTLFTVTAFSQKNDRSIKKQFRENFFQKLNLTEQQKDKMQELRISNKIEMIDLKANLERSKLGMQELRNNDNFTRDQVLAAVDKINQAKNKIAIAEANNKMDMYEILTSEQQKTWKENVFKMQVHEKRKMRRMHHRIGR